MSLSLLKDFLTPLERVVTEKRLLERVKDLKSYYQSFCQRYDGTEAVRVLKRYERIFAEIDEKSFKEKLNLLKEVLSIGYDFFLTAEDIEKMKSFLERPLSTYKGVDTKIGGLLAKKGLERVRDVLFFLPYNYIDKSRLSKIQFLKEGENGYLKVKVMSTNTWKQRGFLSKKSEGFIATVTDGTGYLVLKWFIQPPKFIKDLLVPNKEIFVYGKVQNFKGVKEIHHPEIEEAKNSSESEVFDKKVIPVYFGLPAGISDKVYRRLVFEIASEGRQVLKSLVPFFVKSKLQLIEWGEALFQLHFPENYDEKMYSERRSPYHLTLIYQELFLFFSLLHSNDIRNDRQISAMAINCKSVDEVKKRLSYELTKAQKRALEEIKEDLQKTKPMQRLLQGDVGSGKTVVALLSAMMVIEAGKQVALMAPTEILATQHYLNVKNYLKALNITPLLLVSSMKRKDYYEALEKIRTGEAKLVIGTHALIQEKVHFHELGLVIIDEQHRFGVDQRKKLINKGIMPHVLYLTATPIPRTLTMTLYGDLDVSIIDELPPGRKTVKTEVIPDKFRERAFAAIEEELNKGGQAYVVYPVIDEDNALELKAAKVMYDVIKNRFPQRKVALLHGRMTAEEKEEIMKGFKNGEIEILVSTPVIEVGVDVPNATIMVIEHGERFGLASLHQLRGRIGRGTRDARCIVLVDTKKLSEKARARLLFFRDTKDGFKLAEFDLKLRGPGEIFGTRQSGLPEFGFVDLLSDVPHIELVKKIAEEYFNKVPAKTDLEKTMKEILELYFFKKLDYYKVA